MWIVTSLCRQSSEQLRLGTKSSDDAELNVISDVRKGVDPIPKAILGVVDTATIRNRQGIYVKAHDDWESGFETVLTCSCIVLRVEDSWRD